MPTAVSWLVHLIHSKFIKYLLNNYYVTGTFQGTGGIVKNKTKSLPSWNGILFGVLFHDIEFDIYYYSACNCCIGLSQPNSNDCRAGTTYTSNKFGA